MKQEEEHRLYAKMEELRAEFDSTQQTKKPSNVTPLAKETLVRVSSYTTIAITLRSSRGY